ncbi:MAG: response regulator [Thermoanaerobaculia bacterium]
MSRVDPPIRKRSVLVVDDDPGLQGLFSTLLSRDGFSVDCAANGRLAFEYLRRGSYSVILLDLMMPDVNGSELLVRLERESPALLRRVIVMTGAAQRVVESVDTRRVWGLIRKPFDNNDLLRSARECASNLRPVLRPGRSTKPASPAPL